MKYVSEMLNLFKKDQTPKDLDFEIYRKKNVKKLVFYCKLINGDKLELVYQLMPTSLRDKWITHFKNRQKESNSYINFTMSNKTSLDCAYLMNKLNSIAEKINSFDKNRLPLFTNTKELDANIFNYLHEQFEEYGEFLDRHNKTGEGTWNRELHNLWLSLNEWIHITETAMDITDGVFPKFSCLVHTFPAVLGEPIDEEDKLFLTSNFSWGELYLGYNTLGKDYLHVCKDNDVRVLTNNQIKVQTHFSSEVWMNFGLEAPYSKYFEMRLYHWYQNLEQNEKELVPIDNLNKLALGRYFIGKVEFNDSFFRLSKDLDEWQHNSNLKKRWNLEVFSKIEEVVKMKVLE